MNYKVFLTTWDNTEQFIGFFETKKEVFLYISRFAADNGYKQKFVRDWTDNQGWTWIDYGSYSHFFKMREVND